MPVVRALKRIWHILWAGHLPRWYHPMDDFSRWALREHGVFLVCCERCEDARRVPSHGR